MKLRKPLSWLGLGVILTMLLLLIPTAAAFAAAITVTPNSGAPGVTSVTVSGSGFSPSTTYALYLTSQNIATLYPVIDNQITTYNHVANANSDSTGIFTSTFTIPTVLNDGATKANVVPGTYYLWVCAYTTQSGQNVIMGMAESTLTVIANAKLNAASPATGTPGTTVTLTGTNFVASHAVTVTFDSTAVTPTTGGTTGSDGSLSATFNVPASATAGAHTITVSDGTNSKTTPFTITPYIVATPQSGPAGTMVTLAGNGFGSLKSVTIYFNNQQVSTTLTSTTGDLPSTQFKIPDLNLPAGSYDIKVVDSVSNLGTFPFTLTVPAQPTPTPTPTPTASIQVTANDTSVSISGSNFKANGAITVTLDGNTVSTATADANGAFTTQFNVASSVSVGSHTISVTDGTNTKQYTYTRTAPPAAPTISVLSSGTNVVIQGSDFAANGQITITLDGDTLGTLKANSAGAFVSQIQIPSNLKHGDHTIAVTDGTTTKNYTYTVPSTPPNTPQPISPGNGATPKQPITFEWQPVTADTAITYDLQIATDANFTASSIVINKTGLPSVTYTLTTDEQNQLTGQTTPYYWRISAVDAHDNQSEWTPAITLRVPKPFSFPGWLIYTLAGVGAVIIFGIGYLVGRRTAFYY